MPDNAALQRLIKEAEHVPAPTLRDVQRFALAGYLIGAVTAKYDPNQPRDAGGRWGRGSPGVSSAKPSKINRSRLDRSEDDFRHYSEDEAKLAFQDGYRGWSDNLSKDEVASIKAYTNGEYTKMNGMLRNAGTDPSSPPPTPPKKAMLSLDSAISKAPALSEDTMLYRGMSEKNIYEQVKAGKLKKGKALTDKGYMSTSPKMSSTGVFTQGDHPVVYKIRAEKGAKGAYLGFKKVNAGHIDEAEFLLPRGTKLAVVGSSMKKHGDKDVAEIELAYLAE